MTSHDMSTGFRVRYLASRDTRYIIFCSHKKGLVVILWYNMTTSKKHGITDTAKENTILNTSTIEAQQKVIMITF